jgi:hypothetical protein
MAWPSRKICSWLAGSMGAAISAFILSGSSNERTGGNGGNRRGFCRTSAMRLR